MTGFPFHRKYFAIFVVSLATVIVAIEAGDTGYEAIWRKLADLEQQQRETTETVQTLRLQNDALATTVSQQNQHILDLEQQLTEQAHVLTLTRVHLQRQGDEFRNVTSQLVGNLGPKYHGIQKRAGPQAIAFTVYLDHNIILGDYRTIKFNQEITNIGQAYNTKTGLFMCPRSGVYLFSFSIGERDVAGTHVRLIMNGNNVIDGAVDTFNLSQDLQTTSVAALRLNEHDLVWIEASGDHLEGSETLRLSSFTGVFLYE